MPKQAPWWEGKKKKREERDVNMEKEDKDKIEKRRRCKIEKRSPQFLKSLLQVASK